MNKELLRQFVTDNPRLVSRKSAGDGLSILKYKRTVFYDNLWNEYLEYCRGTIVDENFDVVTMPFRKIYNYGVEAKAPVFQDSDEVIAFRKVNGFMVAATWHNGDVLVSTTGTTDSEFVGYAKEMMLKHMPWADWQMAFSSADMIGLTVMFECVHPMDPHIVPEKEGMYVLGYRENRWDSKVGHSETVLDIMSDTFNCYVPECYRVTVGELKQMAKECRHEGFVFYHADGRSAKIKSPYYLTSKWVARNPRTDKLVDLKRDIKKNLDEEYYPLVDAIRANIVEYTAMDEQARLAWVRNFVSK
jgi:RNA ligase